jgi:cytochrome b subunit of formate dehydrogenase
MEDAINAVATGEVDCNWVAEHHSLWLKDLSETNSLNKIAVGDGRTV